MTTARPLASWRVLVPRGGSWGDRVAARVRDFGGIPVIAPMLNFASAEDPAALANALHELQDGQYDWIVLTSATTVDVLVSQGTRIPDETRVAAVGETTAAALGLAADDYVIDVVRIRLADGTPISLEHVRLPAAFFPGLLDLPLGGSLYELLEEHYGTLPGEAVERIEVRSAAEDEAAILAVEPGSALLSITRTTKDSHGRVFEHSHDLFRADRTVITVRTPAPERAGEGTPRPARVVLARSQGAR